MKLGYLTRLPVASHKLYGKHIVAQKFIFGFGLLMVRYILLGKLSY